MIELVFPKLTSYQQEVYDWLDDPYVSSKICVIKAIRQCGKTFFLQVELIKMAVSHKTTSAIFEPTISLARNVYKSVYKALERTGLIKGANAQLLEIELTNGSTILFRSTESMNRGLSITGLCILDECAYLDDSAIYDILPMVNAHLAPLIIASSPFTMDGYFYDMYMKGLKDGLRIKTFDWSHHPETKRFLTDEQKELYRQTMSRAKFTTEIEGDFLTGGGLLFTNIDKCLKRAENTETIYIGIDFATGSDADYTALSVFNNMGEMMAIHRTNNITPTQQVEWLCELINGYAENHTIGRILGEINSIGKVYVDMMKSGLKQGISITDWVTSNKSKQDLVTTLQLALENEMIGLLNEPTLLNELRHYQAEINIKTKSVTYNGYKCADDQVLATMLGYMAYRKGLGNTRIVLV